MRARFRAVRTEVWVYEGEVPDGTTEADVALMGGAEWDDLTEDLEADCVSEDEDYQQGSFRELA